MVSHVYSCRTIAREPARYSEVLKFIEQDKGLVKWVTLPLIPMEKRWSYTHKLENPGNEFVAEEQCQKEASKGRSIGPSFIDLQQFSIQRLHMR